MGIEEPRDLKKPNTFTPSKYLLQFLVADYYLLVLGILVAKTHRFRKRKNCYMETKGIVCKVKLFSGFTNIVCAKKAALHNEKTQGPMSKQQMH